MVVIALRANDTEVPDPAAPGTIHLYGKLPDRGSPFRVGVAREAAIYRKKSRHLAKYPLSPHHPFRRMSQSSMLRARP